MIESVLVVFVCYNCGKDIVKAIDDIKAGSYPLSSLRICVVDNASRDDSVELLKLIDGIDVEVIESRVNLGFGAGCNLLLKQPLKEEKILLLNPDIHLSPDSIKNLLDFSVETLDGLIWGGRTYNSCGVEDGKNAWKEPSLRGVLCWSFFGDVLLKILGKSIPDAYSFSELEENDLVDAVSGCFFLVDARLFRSLGGFDERYFMYSEEIDFCRRAREIGAKPRATSKATIVHEGSATMTSATKLNFLYHSKLKYFKKYWPSHKYLISRGSIFVGSLLRCLIFSLAGLISVKARGEALVWLRFLRQQLSWRV